jgi:iron complex outermembrane receptor protein
VKHSLFVAIIVIAAACPACSTPSVITGQVLDTDRHPISHVTVQSADIEYAVQTDDNGRFSVSTTAAGPIALTFTHAAYRLRTIKVIVGREPVEVILTGQVYPMEGVTVTAGRAVERQSPVSFATIDQKTIDRDFDIGEVPAFLEITPNLYAYSDAGGGLGYSYLKIRGFDARRAPVYINGVPLNDPEDHALYFVDLPDFTANAGNIQVQRGVGNSLYGDAAFAGSINILTSALAHPRQFSAQFGYGGFLQDDSTVGLMRKSSVAFATGLINGAWSLSARWVRQYSDGYRESSWYDGTAYYLSLGRIDPRMITTLNIYGGPMRTHAAWDGIDRETEFINRRANWYTYPNETDNFTQPHFELHNIYQLTDRATLNSTLYLITGKGYYEQFRYGESLRDYNLSDDPYAASDLTRRKWVDKYQAGVNVYVENQGGAHLSALGGSYYFFDSEHWGEVTWAQELNPSLRDVPARYYEYFGKYHNASVYASRRQMIGDRLTLSGNLQLRYLSRSIHMTPWGLFPTMIYGLDWLFLSPRVGVNYQLTEYLSPYVSFSIASHEPNDDMIDDADDPFDMPRLQVVDAASTPVKYGDPLVDPERVYDVELGFNYRAPGVSADANLFWMEYRHEIVPDGRLNDDGFPTYGNADRAVHRGIELAAAWSPVTRLNIEANYAFNDNLITRYDQFMEQWVTDDSSVVTTVRHRDVVVPAFPTFLANLAVDYTIGPVQMVYRLRGIGRQFVSYDGRYARLNGKMEDVSIAPYAVSSIKGIIRIGNVLGSILTIDGRVDNLFNQKYETNGYRWRDYFVYWPAAERNWFVNVKMTIE